MNTEDPLISLIFRPDYFQPFSMLEPSQTPNESTSAAELLHSGFELTEILTS
jgi:hypothetical protein